MTAASEGEAKRKGKAARSFVNISKEQILEVAVGCLGLCSLLRFNFNPKVTCIPLLLVLNQEVMGLILLSCLTFDYYH